jgi:hypothetical protein
MGLRLRKRLLPVLRTFVGVQTWTFTIDPLLFSSPCAAMEYIRDHRCVAEVVRYLHRRGFLASKRFFCVIEWQEHTQMPHYHVLLDSAFVPFDEVCKAWNRFRPKEAGPLPAGSERPAFGSVRFTNGKARSAKHAANYACAYLIKHPSYGYPDWVLDYEGQIHRYTTSRGFWGDSVQRLDRDEPNEPETESSEDRELDEIASRDVDEPTIRSRLKKCGVRGAVMLVRTVVDSATGVATEKREFLHALPVPFVAAADLTGKHLEPEQRAFNITYDELFYLMGRASRSDQL